LNEKSLNETSKMKRRTMNCHQAFSAFSACSFLCLGPENLFIKAMYFQRRAFIVQCFSGFENMTVTFCQDWAHFSQTECK